MKIQTRSVYTFLNICQTYGLGGKFKPDRYILIFPNNNEAEKFHSENLWPNRMHVTSLIKPFSEKELSFEIDKILLDTLYLRDVVNSPTPKTPSKLIDSLEDCEKKVVYISDTGEPSRGRSEKTLW